MNIEQLRAEFEAWHEERYGEPAGEFKSNWFYDNHEVQAEWRGWQARAALQSKDRVDAERYRWLRNRASTEGICVVHIDYWSEEYRGQAHCEVYDGEFLDKAIDHARRIDGGIMNAEQERAAFEAWANGRCELHLVNPAGRYSSAITQFAWEAFQAGRAALQSQDREDAERYRWLRQQRTISDHACVTWNIGHDWVQMDGAELDAAIDHARRAEGDGE